MRKLRCLLSLGHNNFRGSTGWLEKFNVLIHVYNAPMGHIWAHWLYATTNVVSQDANY